MTSTLQTKQSPITIERTYDAPQQDVWAMWTTKEGLESWWGPEGFVSTVRFIEPRAGGRLEIVMKAADPDVIAYLEKAGQGTENVQRITYSEVTPISRLSYVDRFDYLPGVEEYDVTCTVTLEPLDAGTKLTLMAGPMHDAQWTQLATAGWNSSLEKLDTALAK